MRLFIAIVRGVALCAACVLLSKPAGAFCNVPPIRLDDEFFVSDLVFEGSIVADRKIGLTPDGFFDARSFTWRVDRVFRGSIVPGQRVVTLTGNDSGRFPLDAGSSSSLVGGKFLIFALTNRQHVGLFAVDQCGNSRPLREAASKIREIEDLRNHHGGLIYGSMMDGERNVQITAKGRAGKFSAMTTNDGSFSIKVPPGRYSVVAQESGHVFVDTDIAYKDSRSVFVPEGGGAGLSFREKGR
jgi:hypothetical protein